LFAHDFFAVRAAVRDSCRGMSRAKQRAIFENDRRRFENRNFDFRDGDVYIGRLNKYLDVTYGERLAGHQPRLANGLASDERAVGGFAIADDKFAPVQLEFAMETGNGGMNDVQIGVRTPS